MRGHGITKQGPDGLISQIHALQRGGLTIREIAERLGTRRGVIGAAIVRWLHNYK